MWAFSAYAIGRKKDTRSNNFFSNNDIGKGWNRTFGGRRSEERKDQTRFFQGIVLVNEIFKYADGKSQEEVAFGLSVLTMLLGMEKRKSSKKRQGSILPSDRTRNRDSNRTHSLLFNIAQYYAAIFTGYQPPKPKNNCNITDPDCTVPLDELPPGEGSTVGGAFYDCIFDPEINRFKCWGMR